MNRTCLLVLVVVAAGLSQGCVLHNNRLVGNSMTQASDWYGELGVTGHLNRVEVKSPSDLTKLSILGDANVIYVNPRVTLGKVEVWGEDNKIYVPERLIIRSNIMGNGSEIIRLKTGQRVNLSGVTPTIETDARGTQRGRWDRYDRAVTPAMPERYLYTESSEGQPGYQLTPSYDNSVGSGSYEGEASSAAMPDGYRYADSTNDRYAGMTLQPTYQSNTGSSDYTAPTPPLYANLEQQNNTAPVATDTTGGDTTYTATIGTPNATSNSGTVTTSNGSMSVGTPQATYTTTAAPDPAGSYTATGSYGNTATYSSYDNASFSTPATSGSVEVGSGSMTYSQPTGSGVVNPDPPGSYSGSNYSNLSDNAGYINPLSADPGSATYTNDPSLSGGSVSYQPADTTYSSGDITYQSGQTSYSGDMSYSNTGGTMINGPASTTLAPQDYRGKPGEGIGTYTAPNGYTIQTQSAVVTSTGRSAPQLADPQPSEKPVVVEDYPY